jgi:hypothetical protein
MSNAEIMPMSPTRRFGIGFLIAEGAGAAAWWILVLVSDEVRRNFLWAGLPDSILYAFLLPDALLYIGAPLLAAYGLFRRRRWAYPVLCIHLGAVAYALIYSMSLSLSWHSGWIGAALMLPSLVGASLLALRLQPEASDLTLCSEPEATDA